MNQRSRWTARLFVAALLLATACGDGDDDGAEDRDGAGDGGVVEADCDALAAMRTDAYPDLGFFELLTYAAANNYFPAASVEELAEQSERVFVGKIVAVAPGNLYAPDDGPSGAGGAMGSKSMAVGPVRCARGVRHTTNLTFDVSLDVRGKGPRQVVVEWSHSRLVFTADLMGKLPPQNMLAFVSDYRRFPLPAGAPPGAFKTPFSYFQTPLGLITDTAAGLVFPLESERSLWPEVPGKTLAAIVEALRAP